MQTLTAKQIIERLQARAPKHGDMTGLAKELQISRSFLSQVIHGISPITASLAVKLKVKRIAPDCYVEVV